MASKWTCGTTFQAPYYNEVTGEISEVSNDGSLTFVDFLPDSCKTGRFFSQPKYETFQTLIDHGNEWLRTHSCWKVRTCESVEFKPKRQIIDTQTMTYYKSDDSMNYYIRGLRLWIVPSFENTSQQIRYMNLVPQRINEHRFFGSPSYESLEEVLEKFNTMIRTNPIPGRIINVETQEMKIRLTKFDPDRSNWIEDGESSNRFLYILRVFFEITSSIAEPIGIMDFIPQKLAESGICSFPRYELFTNVVNKAAIWCNQQTAIRICNAQSLEIKFERGKEINAQKMSYVEFGGKACVRILRIVFVKEQNYEANLFQPSIQLTCKTFVPIQLITSYLVPVFETLDQTKKRMEEWIKFTGAQVISVQTAAIRLLRGGKKHTRQEIETNCAFNNQNNGGYFIFIIHLYLNGFYNEPPKELMPPVPELQEQKCVLI